MRDSLRNKILNYEETPPPTVWNAIDRRLNEEFSSSDSILSGKLEAYAAEPPASAWENISQQIAPTSTVTKRPGKVIPIFYRRVAVAVVVAAVLAFGAMYFFTGDRNENLTADTGTKHASPKSVAPRNDTPPRSREQVPINVDVQRQDQSSVITTRPARTRPVAPRKRQTIDPSQNYEATYANVISEAHVSTPDLQPVAGNEPISVSAPPIRDKNGNIILDLDLITKPGQQYITITSPNGNQTRISNKFLSCLSYINSSFTSGDMDENAQDCKQRFEEWRERLLSDGSFIPAADNFFDIFQMKEMIQD